MNAKQIIGLIGSILVIAGCFLPIIRVPIIGGISYVLPPGGNLGDGVFVALLALLGLFAAIRQGSGLLLFSAVGGGAILAYSLVNFSNLLSSAQDETTGLAGAFMSAVGLDMGVGVISTGLVLMLVSSAMPKVAAVVEPVGKLKKCPFCAERVKNQAVVCKHCGRDLPPTDVEAKQDEIPEKGKPWEYA